MRVLFVETPEATLPVLEALVTSEHDVVGILTRADAHKGHSQTLHPSSVVTVARGAGLDAHTPATSKEDQVNDVHTWIDVLKTDTVVVVTYGHLVPIDLLDIPEHGRLNLYLPLPPAWWGAVPTQQAAIVGEEVTGVCAFRLEEGLDTGPIYGRLTEAISGRDINRDLFERLAQAGAPLVLDALCYVEDGSVHPKPQNDALATLAPMLFSADGLARWGDPALAIDRRIRGITSIPGAHTTYQGTRFRLGPVTLIPEITDLLPDQLRTTKHGVLMGTRGCTARLGQVTPAGCSWMPADAWTRRARLEVGAVLGDSPPRNNDAERTI